jgi:hypothetical protein
MKNSIKIIIIEFKKELDEIFFKEELDKIFFKEERDEIFFKKEPDEIFFKEELEITVPRYTWETSLCQVHGCATLCISKTKNQATMGLISQSMEVSLAWIISIASFRRLLLNLD